MPLSRQHQGLPGMRAEGRCTKAASRIVTRNLYEAERAHVRGLRETPEYKRSSRLRKKVEMCFAHLKRNLNFRRLRLRGLSGAKDEFLLAAAAQNLRKLIRFLGQGPPTGQLCAV